MLCASCGTELIAGKRFCHACGAPVRAACPHCGTPVESRFRFCPDCGGPLPAQAPAGTGASAAEPDAGGSEPLARRIPAELARKIRGTGAAISGERKQVTVLFCDIAGSTEIAERLDPEEYRELLDRYLDLTFAEIHRFEGIVNQLAGDGLMALFGAPIAHEDAPERAVHAALAIQARLARFRARGHALRARIGIHTGPVVVGTVGNDLKMDYTAIGDTTNLASRLQGLAEPGRILISEATQRLLRGRIQADAIGPLEVRGKREPIVAYRVVGLKEAATPMAIAKARGLTPWTGREAELAQLGDCFSRLESNLAQIVSVVGDAGSGKSRLLYEFKRDLGSPAPVLFETRCSSLLQSTPFAPWVNMIRGFFDLRAQHPPEEACDTIARGLEALDPGLADTLPYLCRMIGIPAKQTEEVSTESLRRGVFEAFTRVVLSATRHGPVLMIVEDLHWIDDPSREMLEKAVARVEQAPLMILVSHRPDYQPSWRVRAAFTQLHLRRLSDDETRRIVRARAGGELPSALEERILRKAEGNPFFAEELTRAVVEEEQVVRDNGRIRLARSIDEIRIPDTVQELLGARLDRLSPGTKRIAQVASVIGRQFGRDRLTPLLEGEDVDLEGGLAELEDRGVIHRKDIGSADELRFGESVTQEVAYESLLLRERRRLHARVAELLEAESGGSAASRDSLLAHHYARSDDLPRASRAMLSAAERAEALPSYGEAVKLYQRAWTLAERALEAVGPREEELSRRALAATLGLCGAMVIYGVPEKLDPEQPARRGRELAESLGDADATANLTALHGLLLMGKDPRRFQEGVDLVEAGHALALEAKLEVRAITIARALAWIYLLDGRFDAGLATVGAIVAKLEELGEAERLSDAYLGTRYFHDRAHLTVGDLEWVRREAPQTLELARRASNRTIQSSAAATLAQLHLHLAEYEQALRWADESLEIAEGIENAGALRSSAAVALNAQAALGTSGSMQRYLDVVDQTLAIRGDFGAASHILVDGLLAIGDLPRARRVAERIAEHAARAAGGRLNSALRGLARGAAMLRGGSEHWTDAEHELEGALRLSREIGSRSMASAARFGLGELAMARGDAASAEAHAEEALALAQQCGFVRYAERARNLLTCVKECASSEPHGDVPA
jgi:class 3 adenylate cyclase/tetratricopeptide (TPR) repeat protein